jgi:hypothetical protein
MANYVAHHTKKRERLARLEQDLERSIRSGEPREHQLVLADEVRLGRIRVLRAERAEFEPAARGHSDRLAAIDEQIASLEAIASEKILTEYSTRLDHVSA